MLKTRSSKILAQWFDFVNFSKPKMPIKTKKAVLRAAFFLLSQGLIFLGCESSFRKDLYALAKNSPLNEQILLNLDHFNVLGWGKNSHSKNVHVYIEGDGQSWQDPWTISDDPTPPDPMGFRIALADSRTDSILYFARPCQYIMDQRCTPLDWTSDRFGPKVIQTYHKALDFIKAKWHIQTFTLHGYSGGATVALLIAAQRKDIHSVVTFAPLLDPLSWTTYHRYTPLNGSLSPLKNADRLNQTPQDHFFGLKDTEVPYKISSSYFSVIPQSSINRVHKLPNFTHYSDWPGFWKAYVLRSR